MSFARSILSPCSLGKRLPYGSAAFALAALIAGGVPAAHAGSVTTSVNSTAVIYAAGSQSGLAAGAGGSVPLDYSVTGIGSLTFAASGSITLNGGGNFNDPDGGGGASGTSSNSGYGSISGITAPSDGYLVGVFLGAGGPSGAAPAALDFTTGSGTAFTSLSPLIDQVFFIGDGLTGDKSGSTQKFYVPTGATELYLGISDAGGYNGSPGSYNDNSGTFAVTINETSNSTPPTVPEPGSLLLMGSGALAMATALRRRFAQA